MRSEIFKKPLPYLALILAHIIWGGNYLVAKVTLQEFPPASLAFLRFALASLLLAPFLYAETKKVKINPKDLPNLIMIGIFMVTLNIIFFFEGISRTTVISGSSLTMIIPMLSVFVGWVFLKEKIYLINLLGIVLGLIGALIIIGLPQLLLGNLISTTPTSYSFQTVLGNVLIILASVSFVIAAAISQKMLKIYPSMVVTAIAFMVGTLTFFIPALREYLQNPSWPFSISMLGVLGVIYMTLLSSISAYFLFEWGLAKTNMIYADVFQYIEPFIAVTLAILILSEELTIPVIIGAIFIAFGVFLGTFAKEARHRHKLHRH